MTIETPPFSSPSQRCRLLKLRLDCDCRQRSKAGSRVQHFLRAQQRENDTARPYLFRQIQQCAWGVWVCAAAQYIEQTKEAGNKLASGCSRTMKTVAFGSGAAHLVSVRATRVTGGDLTKHELAQRDNASSLSRLCVHGAFSNRQPSSTVVLL